MNRLLSMYQDLNLAGVSFYTWELGAQQAAVLEMLGRYAIFMDFDNIATLSHELVVLAHEGGHISTGATHKVCSPLDLLAKHEYKANKWAIKKLIPKDELEDAVTRGITDPWDLAEHFGVPEDFMRMAMDCYQWW